MFLNYELTTVFYGDTEIGALAHWLEQHVKQARAFIPHPPGLLRDVCEGAIRTIGFQL